MKKRILVVTKELAKFQQLRRFALQLIHSHSGATGVFCLIGRGVYFRFGAKKKMTDARSKFEFRRLKVPELKHILKGKRIPYTEKEQKILCC